jgi:hypothetical protein
VNARRNAPSVDGARIPVNALPIAQCRNRPDRVGADDHPEHQ